MIKSARIFALLLLVFNGLSACYGGWMLMRYPSGSRLGMSVELLKYSPFNDFLIPGIILFLLNGVSGLIIAWLTVVKIHHAEKLIMLQGGILIGWIGVQMMMLQTINYLHIVFGSVGLLLIIMGLMVSRRGIVT